MSVLFIIAKKEGEGKNERWEGEKGFFKHPTLK